MRNFEEMNDTMRRIMEYLNEELAAGDKFIRYDEIAKKIGRSRHSVKYSIEKLRRMGKVKIVDGKLSIA